MRKDSPDKNAIVEAVAMFREEHSYGPSLAEIGQLISPDDPYGANTILFHVHQLIVQQRLEADFDVESKMVSRSLRLPDAGTS